MSCVIGHRPRECRGCHAPLDTAQVVGHRRQQVVEVAPAKSRVTEHRLALLRCRACGKITRGEFAGSVRSGVQYGAGVKARVLYLQQYQLMPYSRTAEGTRDLFGCPLSSGTVANIVRECADVLLETELKIKRGLRRSALIHADETGLRVEGRLRYVHVTSNGCGEGADGAGRTALMYAVWSLYPAASAFVKSLIAAGARVNEADAGGKTALMLAARNNSAELIRTLFGAGARLSVNAKDVEGQTALIHAVIAYGGEPPPPPEAVMLLLEAGARVNARSKTGQTALFSAMYKGPDAVRRLIAAGGDVNVTDEAGRTALMLASGSYSYSSTEMLKVFTAAGADVNAADKRGETLLMRTARIDSSAVLLKALLEAGAEVNAKNVEGQTALMYAIDSSEQVRAEKVRALLAGGADPRAINSQGQTALSLARKAGDAAVIKLLEEAEARRR